MTPKEFRELALLVAQSKNIDAKFAEFLSELYNSVYAMTVQPAQKLLFELYDVDGKPAGPFMEALVSLMGANEKDITLVNGLGLIQVDKPEGLPYNYTVPIRGAFFLVGDTEYRVAPFFLHRTAAGIIRQTPAFYGTSPSGLSIQVGQEFVLSSIDPVEQQYLNDFATGNVVKLKVINVSSRVHPGFSPEMVRELLLDSIRNFRMFTPQQLQLLVDEKLETWIYARTII